MLSQGIRKCHELHFANAPLPDKHNLRARDTQLAQCHRFRPGEKCGARRHRYMKRAAPMLARSLHRVGVLPEDVLYRACRPSMLMPTRAFIADPCRLCSCLSCVYSFNSRHALCVLTRVCARGRNGYSKRSTQRTTVGHDGASDAGGETIKDGSPTIVEGLGRSRRCGPACSIPCTVGMAMCVPAPRHRMLVGAVPDGGAPCKVLPF